MSASHALDRPKKDWWRCPQRRIKGSAAPDILAMLALCAARGSGIALDTLPPAFATWQGCRTMPAILL